MKSSWIVPAAALALAGMACTSEPEDGAPREAVETALGTETEAGASPVDLAAATTAEELGLDLGEEGLVLGEPVSSGNLVAWPIVPAGPLGALPDEPAPQAYLTLDQALASGRAQVLETGSVNELALENGCDRPIFVLAGEVLKGGRQDRIVGKDLVIAPGQKAPLASFCVEQGRWSVHADDAGGGKTFASAQAVVASSVRYAAQVQDNQSYVWANTAAMNASFAAAPATGTYLATLEDDAVSEQVDQLARRVLEATRELGEVRGLVVALDPGGDDELVCAELFGDPALYRALEPKLVRAYALDAVSREAGRDLVAAAPPQGERAQLQTLELDSLRGLGYLGGGGGGGEAVFARTAPPAVLADAEGPARVSASTPGLERVHRTIYATRR